MTAAPDPAALVQRIEALRGFELEYRARLDAYLAALLATLRMEAGL